MTRTSAAPRPRPASAVLVTVVLISLAVAAAPAAAHDPLVLVSAGGDGRLGTGPSGTYGVAVSADGRVVAFGSVAPDLVDEDGDAEVDVYVRDLDTGRLVLASTSADGRKAEAFSLRPSVDADGDVVAFTSAAANLVPTDTDALTDVYVKDLGSGALALASTTSDGTKGDANSSFPSLSADGRRVAFVSGASNLSPDDEDAAADVFVKDLGTGSVSVASAPADGAGGLPGPYGTGQPSLSADGLVVAFDTDAALVPEDGDAAPDVYVKDLGSGELVLASVSSTGEHSDRGSYRPSLSADGHVVAFDSSSTDLSPEDPLPDSDVYVKDLRTGGLRVASSTSTGTGVDGRATDASLSGDGSRVAFSSDAEIGPALARGIQTWVKDLRTGVVSLASTTASGAPADTLSISPRLSADGLTVAFSTPSALQPFDTNGWADVYARLLGPEVPAADTDVPHLQLAATPPVLPRGGRAPVSISGHASDPGSGLRSVRLSVTDEYGIVHRVFRQRVTKGQSESDWRVTVRLPGRPRVHDSDGREFTIWATATDVSGNTAQQHVHVVAPGRRDRTPSLVDVAAAQQRTAVAVRDGGDE